MTGLRRAIHGMKNFPSRDFKKIFNGYDLSINHYLSSTTKSFLVNNLVYVALGYLDDFTNNFGTSLNHIDDTKLYHNIYELVSK